MDMGDLIALVALIAAAASLTWQRISTQEQRQTRAEDERARTAQRKRDLAALVTQKMALVSASATKYARLESRLTRLQQQTLASTDAARVTEQLARVKKRYDFYDREIDEASALLRDLHAGNARPPDDIDRLIGAFDQLVIQLQTTAAEESKGIEDDIARLEQQYP